MASERISRPHSITVQLVLVIFLLLLPVVFLSAFINVRFLHSGVEEVERSRTQLLETRMSQIDRELDLAANYMNSLTFGNGTTIYLTDRSSPRFFYAANAINQEIARTALYYQYISGFFLSVPASQFHYTYLLDRATLTEQAAEDFVTRQLHGIAGEGWQECRIGDSRCLVLCYASNGIYGGALLNLDQLSAMEDLAPGGVRFCREDQLPEMREQLPAKSVLLQAPSEKCSLVLCEILPQEEALASMPFIQRYLVVITLFMLASVPLVYLLLRHLIIRPLHRLTSAMEKLEQGDLGTRMAAQEEKTREFVQIGTTFNGMAEQIRNLKIAVYEKQLENEKTRLQNLSYQLRPHFMVNTLNMAYNMITCGEYDAAKKLMRFSANYMRSLLSQEGDFVPLQDELKQLEDYMGIQAMRYEGQFDYKVTVDPFVEDISIPSMILPNFVENSIKYSISPDRFTKIRLSVGYCESGITPQACITVKDNGAGYPDWLLEALAAGNLDALRDRVGLRNTLMRIRMLYGEEAECEFFNDGGAVTRFRIPLDQEDE